MNAPPQSITAGRPATARAVLLGERIDTAGFEADSILSTNPLAFRTGAEGFIAVFRYGVAVLIGLTASEQTEVVQRLRSRVKGEVSIGEEESAVVEASPDCDDQILPGGAICLKTLTPERLLVIADALSKSVVLARDEREVAAVFDIIEPFARKLAQDGRTPGGRRAMLKHIGRALLVQHRVSGLAAVGEKPDVLWDRPDLERLYSRLEDEYELKERVNGLNRKLSVITETAQALTDIIDTERSLRLELIIVLLIMFEIVITFYEMFTAA